jgi:hypothetical protein
MKVASALLWLLGLALALEGTQTAYATVDVRLAPAEASLTGPWQFRLGNNPQWASPQFDDAAWEQVDLTPLPGAHDGDVGLSNYVPGWTARGHLGQWGHAWYRLRVHWSALDGSPLVLVGPTLVDDAYEIFWNGQRIGGVGDFSADPPRAFSTRPRLYRLPITGTSGEAVIAIHVYLQQSTAGAVEAGGMHVAPILAQASAGESRLLAQWWQTFWGYFVEVAEPVFLLALALYALSLRGIRPPGRFWVKVAFALFSIALLRLNQAVSAWTEIETVKAYDVVRLVVLGPLTLTAWLIAWNGWTSPSDRRIDLLAMTFGTLAAIAALAGKDLEIVRMGSRLALLVLYVWVAWNIVRRGTLRPVALVTMLSTGVAMFAEEINAIGIPGIWFPFGVGVSRSQYALAVAIPLLAALFHFRAMRRFAGAAL